MRKVDTFGVITTIAGNGGSAYLSDGVPGIAAAMAPYKVAFGRSNNLFICDQYNDRAYELNMNTGMLYCVAGNGIAGDSGDGGAATAASINRPTGIAIDACGNAYITNSWTGSTVGNGRRIRKVTFNPPTTPTITVTGVTTATVGTTVTINATVSGAGSSYTIKWFKNSSLFSTTTVPVTTYVKGAGTDVITARVVPAVLTCYDSVTSAGHSIGEGTVGVEFPAPVGELLIYPNPVGGVLCISFPGQVENVVVTNIVGQQIPVHYSSNTTGATVDVAHLPKGVYSIRVNGVYVRRFVRE